MTNYIEEMMQTAGGSDCHYCAYQREECGCNYCDTVIYPTFTPAKQLEIIKLIMPELKTKWGSLSFDKENDKYCATFITHERLTKGEHGLYGNNKDFAQALAQLTTELMKTGELDKEKVKEILQ